MHGLINISEATSIALHSCAWIAASESEFSSVKTISEGLGFSPHHTAKVAQQLVRAGIFLSERGPAGGMKLAKSIASISIMALCEATGSFPADNGCLLKSSVCNGSGCMFGKVLCDENRRLLKIFTNTTLDDIVKSIEKSKLFDDIKGNAE